MEIVILRIPDHEQEADDVEECCGSNGLANSSSQLLAFSFPIPFPEAFDDQLPARPHFSVSLTSKPPPTPPLPQQSKGHITSPPLYPIRPSNKQD